MQTIPFVDKDTVNEKRLQHCCDRVDVPPSSNGPPNRSRILFGSQEMNNVHLIRVLIQTL
ncbi:hypothetical protein I79_004321 [Cricetulus griseus]|uniref:Uncharacterized protein n=1 Tax=Cricetulus griseus TaxID=10029 RepID=G3H2B4_CRIGR|nr:hypothetical protein I79_004321 [Cricetulus griseus]